MLPSLAGFIYDMENYIALWLYQKARLLQLIHLIRFNAGELLLTGLMLVNG